MLRFFSTFFLCAAPLAFSVDVAWQQIADGFANTTEQGNALKEWTNPVWDSQHNMSLWYMGDPAQGPGIYSNAIRGLTWNAGTSTPTWVILGVSPGAGGACNSGSDYSSPVWPQNRHPSGQLAWNSDNNYLLMYGGVCGGGNVSTKTARFTHSGTTGSGTWTLVQTTNSPGDGSGTMTSGFMSYNSFYRVFFLVGTNGANASANLYVYCDTAVTAVGCTTAQDWILLSTTGSLPISFGSLLVSDPTDGSVYKFGGANGLGVISPAPFWKYNPSTQVWSNQALTATGTMPISTYYSYGAWDSLRRRMIVAVDWDTMYDYSPVSDAWTTWTTSGQGPRINSQSFCTAGGGECSGIVYHPDTNVIASQDDDNINGINRFFVGSLLAPPSLSVPVTLQETLYVGGSTGVARTDEPFCTGVPLADASLISGTSSFGLTGATAGQFRILGSWPSGNAKWVEVCGVLASLSAGGTGTVTLVNSGSGNFGGSSLATDGTPIVISTNGGTCGSGSAVCFEIKKANHNGVDRARIGSTTVVSSGASDGFVFYGPDPTAAYPGNVTCSPTSGGTACTTLYKSSNDPASTCSVEKNGPVQAIIKCDGSHIDGASNAYMKYTVRYHFFKGKSWVKVTNIIRNADYGTNNTFATAVKGHAGYELRVAANLSGTLNFSIANHTGSPSTGTLSGSDLAYVYQGESTLMKDSGNWCGFGCLPYTTDTGYVLKKNSTTLTSGTNAQYPQGWADINNGSGLGIQIGAYQFSAYWPMSLEFQNGGADVRIGIKSAQNSQPYYQLYPQWEIHDLLLNFHTSAPSSLPDEFLKFQHYLVGRADFTQYNSSNVFPYTMIDKTEEDNYYLAQVAAASPTIAQGNACADPGVNCFRDFGIDGNINWPLYIYRFYGWHAGGGGNQSELRWGWLQNFLTRGFTGRYLGAAHFYRMLAEISWPHADGFTWRSKTGETDGFGQPSTVSSSANYALGQGSNDKDQRWIDQEHGHWYGMGDYYFMTGDETIRDAIVPRKDWYMNNTGTYQGAGAGGKSGTVNTSGTAVTRTGGSSFDSTFVGGVLNIAGSTTAYPVASVTDASNLTLTVSAGTQTGASYTSQGGVFNTRSVGVELLGASRYYKYLKAIGDVDADSVLDNGVRTYNAQIKPELCVSGYPAGCSFGPAIEGLPYYTEGVSRTRGVHWGAAGNSGGAWGSVFNCATTGTVDVTGSGTSVTWVSGPTFANASAGDYIVISGLQYVIASKADSTNLTLTTAAALGSGLPYDNGAHIYRTVGAFHEANLVQGIWEFINAKGTSWTDYWEGLDLAYGVSTWALTESYADNGSSIFTNQGFRYDMAPDIAMGCNPESTPPNMPSNQTIWPHFYIDHQVTGGMQSRKFNIALHKLMNGVGIGASDFGSYQLQSAIDAALRPGNYTLGSVTPTGFVDNGGGSYTVSWIVPVGAQRYRIKWGLKQIVDSLGFDAITNLSFTYNPASYMPWFAAREATGIPVPGSAGATQNITIATGVTGLAVNNFSVKALASAVSGGGGSAHGGKTISGGKVVLQ